MKKWFLCETCDVELKTQADIKEHKSRGHEVTDYLTESQVKDLEKTEKNKEPKPIIKTKGMIGDYYTESILLDGRPYFLCNAENELKLTERIEYEDKIFIPEKPNSCAYDDYSFNEKEINELMSKPLNKEELLKECKEKIDYYIDICELDKILILGDLFLSYCQNQISTLHYPYFVGETESGKSTVLLLFKELGYRCFYSLDITYANIYNFLGTEEEGAGVICEDEAQDIAFNAEKIRIYKNSYAKGSRIARIINADSSNKKQIFYKPFCLKVFAGEMVPENKGFKERLAVIHMTEGLPKANIKRLSKEAKEIFRLLRNALLVWKVQNINNPLGQGKWDLEKRDQELWEDYQRVLYGTKYQYESLNVAEYYIRQRHQSVWDSIEAKIFKIVLKRVDEEKQIDMANFWLYLTDENYGDPDLPGKLEKQTFWPLDYPNSISRNLLAKLFLEKFQSIRKKLTEIVEGKKHERTLYEFDPEIVQKLSKKYNTPILIDSPFYATSGEGGEGGHD